MSNQELNWVREYNKLIEVLNHQDSYFTGSKFINVVREFDQFFPDYNQYLNYRREKGLSTSRKNYFYDILMEFKEDLRLKVMDRLFEVAEDMKSKNTVEANADFDVNRKPKDESNTNFTEKKSYEIKTETIDNPIVFISYSWDDEDHKRWVLNLSSKLFEKGIQVILDRYELNPGSNMIHFMEQSIPKADKVLIIFTPNYKIKADGRTGGVGYEYSILNSDLYSSVTNNEKYIPILKSGDFSSSIPSFMQQFIAIDFSQNESFEERFNELVLSIYNKPLIEKPALGSNPFTKNESKTSVNTISNESVSLTPINHLKILRDKTQFLWPGLTEGKSEVKEEIMEKTLLRINDSLNALKLNGLMNYSTEFAYNMITSGEKVFEIKIFDIATQAKNLISLIVSKEV